MVAAAGLLGVKRIDYVLITHYHADHVGGPEDYIANLDTSADAAYGLAVSVYTDGGMQVTNQRNGFTERYPERL